MRIFIIAAALLVAALSSPAQSPTADSFNPGALNFTETVVARVESLVVQPDGKILVGGGFSHLGGQTCTNIGRLDANGSLDTNFNARVVNGYDSVICSGVQPDGKILVGGWFTSLGGQACTNLGRLNTDGGRDATFNPNPNGEVMALAVQPDGKILVGEYFYRMGGQTRYYIGRLNTDGIANSLNPRADNGLFSLALQPDGKILVGGDFMQLGGQARTNIGRLNSNGSLDTFNPGVVPSGAVKCMAVQADGKILVGGWFSSLGGQACTNIGRLNADGSLDTSFNSGADYTISCLALQADGKILVGGSFTTLGGQACTNIGRLNADGSLDSAFNPGVGNPGCYVDCLALQANGKILVGGNFTRLGGQARTNLGRLNNTGDATQSLAFDGSMITWQRGGTSPEVWRTTFDVCTNGTDWINLGAGTRITGGWQLAGLNYPTNAIIRARGFVCGASWFVETNAVSPVQLRFVSINGSPATTNGMFNVHLMGTTGHRAVVERSADMATWTPWQTNVLPAIGWNVAVPANTNCQQFLRARLAQ